MHFSQTEIWLNHLTLMINSNDLYYLKMWIDSRRQLYKDRGLFKNVLQLLDIIKYNLEIPL